MRIREPKSEVSGAKVHNMQIFQRRVLIVRQNFGFTQSLVHIAHTVHAAHIVHAAHTVHTAHTVHAVYTVHSLHHSHRANAA